MTKQEKIDRIYEVIADKTLSFGCGLSVELWGENRHFKTVIVDTEYKSNGKLFKTRHPLYQIGEWELESRDELTIIGHPVMIGDVLDWYLGNDDWSNPHTMHIILFKWKEMRKPIEDQSDECRDFVYKLVTNE